MYDEVGLFDEQILRKGPRLRAIAQKVQWIESDAQVSDGEGIFIFRVIEGQIQQVHIADADTYVFNGKVFTEHGLELFDEKRFQVFFGMRQTPPIRHPENENQNNEGYQKNPSSLAHAIKIPS